MTKHQWIAAEGVQKGSLYRGSDVRCEDECGVEKQFWDGSHLRLVFRPIVEWTCTFTTASRKKAAIEPRLANKK